MKYSEETYDNLIFFLFIGLTWLYLIISAILEHKKVNII